MAGQLGDGVFFQQRQGAADLVALAVEVRVPVFFRRAQSDFVTHQHSGVHDPIGQRGQGQAAPAGGAFAGDQRVADVLVVEVVEDHPAVVDDVAVGQAQGGDFAQGVVIDQRQIRIDRGEHAVLQGHAVLLTGFVQQHHDFTDEGGKGVVVQGHARGGHGNDSVGGGVGQHSALMRELKPNPVGASLLAMTV
ncbi:hypothetical protein D3C71_868170 [compost metagenome]